MKTPNASEIATILGFLLLGCGLWKLAPWISLAVTGATLIAYGVATDIIGALLLQHKRKQGPK